MVRIRIDGDEMEVLDAMDALEDAKVVRDVSRIYACRGSRNDIKMYAQETREGRICEIVGHPVTAIEPVFGDGKAGWYGWVKCESRVIDKQGPFETKTEAIEHAKEVAAWVRGHGLHCMELWEICDRWGSHVGC